ncbi:hypothetical protein Syun_024195 [Stephania yunnanensis]|uniref:Uncharacterized protein n=1 Tax=Stephania yunnanensis TaxID=152371 RepID=A0AAP0FBI5_9MAGN
MEFVKGHEYYYYSLPIVVFTSWTATNSSRQFYGCKKISIDLDANILTGWILK